MSKSSTRTSQQSSSKQAKSFKEDEVSPIEKIQTSQVLIKDKGNKKANKEKSEKVTYAKSTWSINLYQRP